MKRFLTGLGSLMKIAMIVILMAPSLSSLAQGRSFIKEKIQQKGECRNVAITKTNGDLMLYGSNGWAGTALPKGLTDALNELNNDNEYIDDVQLTEQGRWLILVGNNGFRWSDIPYSLESKLREYNRQEEVVTSVTFNDAGDWIVITQNYISASEGAIQDWLAEGLEKYGQLWAACVTEDAIVAVYEQGYRFYGIVPETLKSALNETNLDVFRLKIAGSAWFFADQKGRYQYYM